MGYACWYIGVRTEKIHRHPQKLGLTSYPGWSAYWQEAGTFAIYDPQHKKEGEYPDCGSRLEVS